MAINKVCIENFRSIKHLELKLGPINALIGLNNSGKSNVLRALNLVLGETWPTRPFSEKDFHAYDTSQTIQITVFFDNALNCDPDVAGFCLRYSAIDGVDYFPVDRDGNPCRYPGVRGYQKRVSNQMRDERALLYLGLDRQANSQVRTTQWTLYGRLLRKIEGTISPDARRQFAHDVEAAVEAHVRGSLAEARKIIDEFVCRQTGLEVKLNFRALDPLDILKGVRPFIADALADFDAEEVGAGVQSALAVAIARAYAKIVRAPLVLAIEEPELYLHPHGCRHFHKLLRELAADGLQVIYATHERSFVDAGEFEGIHIVRRRNGATEVTSGLSISASIPRERLRIQSRFNDALNEVFFARCVILVEGYADEIACRCALEKQGIELDRESISVVSLGGKQELPVVAELLCGFRIPTVILMDEDPEDATTRTVREKAARLAGERNLFLQSPKLEGLFGLQTKLSRIDAISLFPKWFDENDPPEVYRAVARRVKDILASGEYGLLR